MMTMVATLDDLWSGEMRAVTVEGQPVLLVNLEGTVRAYADRCAHQRFPLSQGRLEGFVLTCRAHEWQYDVRTGAGMNPSGVKLAAFPVEVREGSIWVDVEGTEA
jgi:toluene monooxygenase system ferredoxin subunit